jgi:hypothetical protein
MEKEFRGRHQVILGIGLALSGLILCAAPASAAPWWWAQFTIGDGTNTSNSGFERWEAFVADLGTPATDSTYVCSFTWGSADIGPINGINGANTAGLNNHSAAGYPTDYLIGDGDGGANWTNAKSLSDANVTDVTTEPAGGDIMHIKDIFVENKGYLISSANMTAGGFDSQNNNAIFFPWWAMSTGMRAKVRDQMREMAAGTFQDATQYGTINFFSPYGDTIELRYAPEDNDGGTGASATAMLGRYRQLAQAATQSIFFMSDAWSSSAGTDGLRDDILANNKVTVRGCAGAGTDWDATTKSNFEGDANGTLRNEAGSFNRLHSKTFIFDMEIVGTGSANMTATAMVSAAPSNDEVNIIVHDFRLARRYMNHYHKIMAAATADPSSDGYDNTTPAGATGLSVAATDTAFYASWTASATSDVTRYYLFIDTAALTQNKIGDFIDDDVDGYYDEDPRGDYDGFASGATAVGKAAADDDADGATDEDLWMPPEVMVKGKTRTSGAITTWNVGDTLLINTDYYFAIVSVDTQGNEGTIATFGSIRLATGADTSLQIGLNSVMVDTNVHRNDTNIIAANLYIRGETTTTGDTLRVFAVRNIGTADSTEVTVKLWRDEDSNTVMTAGVDSLVGTLAYTSSTGRYQATFAASDSRVRLGTAGKSFFVTVDVSSTAAYGKTFEAQIDARTCSAVRNTTESGPKSGKGGFAALTVISTNPVNIVNRADYPTASIAKGTVDSAVMSLQFTVASANDTIQVMGVRNIGTMTSSDVAALRIYHDGDGDSVIDAAPTDTLIASLRYVSGSDWRADTIAYRFSGTSVDLIVALSVSATATAMNTFIPRIMANSADAIVADTGPSADVTSLATFSIPSDTAPDDAIVVNEFYSSPPTTAPPDHDNDGIPGGADEEYIELYNTSDASVDVSGWDVSDNSSAAVDVTLPTGVIMGPHQFVILYPDTPVTEPQWRLYDSSGAVIIDSGRYASGTFPGLNNNADSVRLRAADGTVVDMLLFTGGGFSTSSSSRMPDGSSNWFTTRQSSGINSDPSTIDTYSPNAIFSVTTDSNLPPQGVNFGLIMTMRTRANQTCSTFAGTAVISASTGTISPSTTGAFAAGLRQDSFMITGAVGICTISVRYNVTTVGYCTVNIQPGPPPDTKIVVTINSHLADTSSPRGTDTAIILRFRVRGETVGAGDTLVNFVCENLGLADELDAYLELWRDNDNDSQWTTADSKVAGLARNGAFWSASGLSAVGSAYLGSGGSAGRNFMIIANTYDTATLNDTLQLKINSLSFDAVVGDSGPVTGFTNSGKLTIVSANQVVVTIRGDTPSETIPLDETRVAMQILLSVTAANDTITGFAVTNVGTMGNSDVAAIRLWHDHSADSILTAADTLIAVLPFASGLTWRNTSISYPFSGASIPLLVTIQTAAGAAGLATFRGQITAYEAGTQNGDSGPTASISTIATFTTPSDTVLDTFVVLNEFIVDPAAIDHDNDGKFGDGDEEYVELFNTGSGTVNVGGWKIEDDQTAGGDITLSPATIYLGPKQFLVVYADSDLQGRYWYRFASDGITIMDSGSYAGTWNQFNNAANGDSVHIRNSTNALIDSSGWYTNFPSNRAYARRIDGVGALTDSMFPTPGKNSDPTAAYNRASPNANLLLSAIPSAITEGDSLTLTMTMRDSNDSPVTTFSSVVSLTSDTGNVTPDTSGAFTAGVRADSITVTEALATCSVVITSAYNTTTTGTTAITVYRRATITATINLEARGDESGCTGTLANGVDTYIAASNASGTITFTNVKAGSYSLTTKENHHLRRVMTGIAVVGVDSTVTVGVHRAGDANNDNRVNIFDGGVVRFTMISGAGTPADIDGSGAVNNADLQWIRNNFGRDGD